MSMQQVPPATTMVVGGQQVITPLGRWAAGAREAAAIAHSIARTSFMPASFKKNMPEESWPSQVCAAILAGQELGLEPMQALGSINIIQGQPALNALAMRALVQAAGHEMWIDTQTDNSVTMKGQRKGSDRVHTVTWTLARARQAGLMSKDNWQNQPTNMMVARCTSELARLIGADVILGLAYSAEELGDDGLDAAPAGKAFKRAAPKLEAVEAAPEPAEPTGADVGPAEGTVYEAEAGKNLSGGPICAHLSPDDPPRYCIRPLGHTERHRYSAVEDPPVSSETPEEPAEDVGKPPTPEPEPRPPIPAHKFERSADTESLCRWCGGAPGDEVHSGPARMAAGENLSGGPRPAAAPPERTEPESTPDPTEPAFDDNDPWAGFE